MVKLEKFGFYSDIDGLARILYDRCRTVKPAWDWLPQKYQQPDVLLPS